MTLGRRAYEAAGCKTGGREVPWKDLPVQERIRWDDIARSVRSVLDIDRIAATVSNVLDTHDVDRFQKIAASQVRMCREVTCEECERGNHPRFDWTQADIKLRWFHESAGEYFACPASAIIITFGLIAPPPHHQMGFNPAAYPVEYPDAYSTSGVAMVPQINPEPAPGRITRLLRRVFPSRAVIDTHVEPGNPNKAAKQNEAKEK